MNVFIVLALIVVPEFAAFAQQRFLVNPDNSQIHIKLSTTHEMVNGTFHIESGMIEFDRSSSHMAGTIIVAAGSGKTGNDSRDRKMNKDILKSDQFAVISFAPKTYSGAIAARGDSTIQVSGIFKLLGTSHDLTIPIQVHMDPIQGHADGQNAIVTGKFDVPYVAWGLKNPSFLIWKADNDVAVDFHLVGQVQH